MVSQSVYLFFSLLSPLPFSPTCRLVSLTFQPFLSLFHVLSKFHIHINIHFRFSHLSLTPCHSLSYFQSMFFKQKTLAEIASSEKAYSNNCTFPLKLSFCRTPTPTHAHTHMDILTHTHTHILTHSPIIHHFGLRRNFSLSKYRLFNIEQR